MVNLRQKLVVQSQVAERESRALCGLYSINNALQEFNFLDMKQMKVTLQELEVSRPGEDHGSNTNGAYSMAAFKHVLAQKGYKLVHLNRVQFLFKKSKKEWHQRIVSSKFTRLLIIGQPPGQADNIYRCIASTTFKKERYIIDPDEGQREKLTVESLGVFLPSISSVYTILTKEEVPKYDDMVARAKIKATRSKEKKRLARVKKVGTVRQRRRRNKDNLCTHH